MNSRNILSPVVLRALDLFHRGHAICIDYKDHDPESEPQLVEQVLYLRDTIVTDEDLVTAMDLLVELGVGLRFVDESRQKLVVPELGLTRGETVFAIAS
jgi:hypothetical protein